MSLKNINSFPRFTKHLVASRVFEQKPLTVVDIGARGGFEPHWSLYGNQVKLIGFEANLEECERLNRQASNSGNRFFPAALHQNRGKKLFYVTALPDSSGFYPADMNYVQRFPDEANLSVLETLETDTVDFDSFASENSIDYVDFIKLDTEGSELDILKGAARFLKKAVIGLSVEVWFFPWHKGQPVFNDVDSYLRSMGFWLFDLATYRHARKSLKPRYRYSINDFDSDYGQIIWGQALYLRDGVNEINSAGSLEDGWDDIKIMKLASIMELFCLPDCAIELIQAARRQGFLQGGCGVEHFIDLLVPGAGRQGVSYHKYLKNMERPDRTSMFIRRGKQFVRKVVPRPIRHIIRKRLIKLRDLMDKIVS